MGPTSIATGAWPARIAAALLALAPLAAACAPPGPSPGEDAAAAESPVAGGEMVIAETAEPQHLDCLLPADSPSLMLCRLIADSLVDHDRELRVVPRLARSFDISGDGRVITFHLRDGVRWHDGTPFTSADVISTVERIRHPDSEIRGNLPALFEPLDGIEAPDAMTVVARYREPYALAWQAWSRAFILPAHAGPGPGGRGEMARHPVGTGPFRFAAWEPGVRIVLQANADYFAGRPHLDRLVYRVVPDRRALTVGLRTGEIDVAGLNPTEAPPAEPDLPFEVLRFPGPMLDFILWNTREDPGLFTDPAVRRAFSLAFDRGAYIEHVTGGNDRPAVSTFLPSSWAHDPSLQPLPHDPGQAAALLEGAGWRDRDGDGILDTPKGPARFTLLYFSGLPVTESIASLLKESLEPLGVRVDLQGLDWPTLRERVQTRAFHASVYRWTMGVEPDPYDFFHSSQAERGQNFGGYSNSDVDRLAEQARRILRIEERAAIYHRMERILREEQPYTFISHPATALGVSRRVGGLEIGPQGFWGWYPAPLRWWVRPGQPRRR